MVNNLGEFHYAAKPFNVEGDYDLHLIGEPNYMLLENQRIIKSLILSGFVRGKEGYDNRVKAMSIDHEDLISDLNLSVNYKNVYKPNLEIKKG